MGERGLPGVGRLDCLRGRNGYDVKALLGCECAGWGGRSVRGVDVGALANLNLTRCALCASRRLGLAGVSDVVEFHRSGDGETPYPVEYKRGKPKAHRADEVQLCAQGLCLEEMTGRPVPEGALFYGETRRRVEVRFDDELRRLTENAAAALRELFAAGRTPPAEYERRKCRACSLLDLCRPQAFGRSAKTWRERQVRAALDNPSAAEGV